MVKGYDESFIKIVLASIFMGIKLAEEFPCLMKLKTINKDTANFFKTIAAKVLTEMV